MTEQEYDEIIAPLLLEVANKCADLGGSIVANVEWEPGEGGSTIAGTVSESFPQIMNRAAIKSNGNIDAMLLHLVRHYDVSASMFLHSYNKKTSKETVA